MNHIAEIGPFPYVKTLKFFAKFSACIATQAGMGI